MNRTIGIPPIPKVKLDKRFSFIHNKNIRENICIYTRYITFLIQLITKYEGDIQPEVCFSIYKDIIIYCGQIAEACCYDVIKRIVSKEGNKILGTEWKTFDNHYNLMNFTKFELKSNFGDIKEFRVKTEIQYKKPNTLKIILNLLN
jgi:hypothetical protein